VSLVLSANMAVHWSTRVFGIFSRISPFILYYTSVETLAATDRRRSARKEV
jgi:hypothetical protein